MECYCHKPFFDFDGEVNSRGQGTPSIFVRFHGCNLSCPWCDAQQAITGNMRGYLYNMLDLVRDINMADNQFGYPHKLTITGGEPLLQIEAVQDLIKYYGNYFFTTIETNGTVDVSDFLCVDCIGEDVDCMVYDYKLPSAKPKVVHCKLNWDYMRHQDFMKFVIADYEDFKMACDVTREFVEENFQGRLAFSPLHGIVTPDMLVRWLRSEAANLPMGRIILNTQIHKQWKNYEEVA